ncbi:endonuclease [Hymenobacter sp. AT01-02]|uniref:endonuclease n=1 Tax=Hymenobacter sp. AT01-02 TaxID=1571877 RepID=UPI0005F1F48F|nr:endonuclease [Hymenobacter sp. AT01-02]
MKNFFSWMLAAALGLHNVATTAQTMPAAPPTSLQGQQLKDWLRENWYDNKRMELSYSEARGRMYNFVDNQNGRVVCVYSGYTENTPLDSTNTSPSVVNDINCEHTIPQSWFNEVVRMRSDIHHLFPTYETWNSNRGSDPFADIPDAQTQLWMRNTQSQTTIPTANINEYSEDTNTQFEPREDHKGNLARAAFYFYTMHQNQTFDPGKGSITALADLNTLYQWHLADPVDARERERNRRAAKSQGNFNPYIAYPELVGRAWGFQTLPAFSFATATASVAEGNTGTTTYMATISLSEAATAPLTVEVALDAASSTATAATDFTFTSPQTLTFAAGQTSQTITLTVTVDATPEADETVVLRLQNVSAGGALGATPAHTLTITNDDGPAPTIQFAAATGTIAEGNTGTSTYTVNVTLSGLAPSTAVTIPVTVSTTGATATTATDYTLTTTSLTFAAGQASQTFPVTLTVVGDTQIEPNETVRLVLGTPTTGGAVLGTLASHVLTITNDDLAPAGPPCTTVFFSEYIEGSTGNTKVLELYNPSPAPISLDGLEIRLYPNGATTPTSTQALTGTIAPGDVYVVANTGVTSTVVQAQTDLQSSVNFFNGDDAIILFDGTDTLDVIGVVGQQPNSGWTVTGGTTVNNTLVRKATVSGGQKRWSLAAADWQALGADVYTNVGRHSSGCVATSTTQTAPLNMGIEVYPNPASGNVQIRLPELRGRHTAIISLYNALGQEVFTTTRTLGANDPATVAVQNVATGLYSVRVTVDGTRYTSRVAVQH